MEKLLLINLDEVQPGVHVYPERRALPTDVHGRAEEERWSVMKIKEPLEERRSCGQRWKLLTYKVLSGPPPSCPEELTA